MKYIILAYESTADFAARGSNGSVRQGEYWAAWKAYGEALGKAGVVESMHGLQAGETAATMRVRDGVRETASAPYAPASEQLGGYFVIDVADQAAALDWAARCPAAAQGAVEVRPLLVRA